MKVFFEKIERSYYDNSKNEIHLREELIGNPKELKEVLEHELTHFELKKTWKNIFFEYNDMFKGILFLILLFLFTFFMQKWIVYQQLLECAKQINAHTLLVNCSSMVTK
jgi:hypothetical protein